ncbi:hypothetical protein ACHWQZ_G001940 [Mnemiopsis leidyi]
MAIFGKAVMRTNNLTSPIRDGNDWDVFLNYFFAVLFMIFFLVGITVNPLIILYHSKQKRTFAKVLFLLISIIDLIRSVYFPLVLVPKLLSPPADKDFYYDMSPSSVHWTSYSNRIISVLLEEEQEILVALCVLRFFTIRDPLSNAKKRNLALSVILFGIFVLNTIFAILDYTKEPFAYFRISDSLTTVDTEYITGVLATFFIFKNVLRCILLLVGGIFSGLTILHLKKSDTAACEASEKNVRKGILSIVAMNVFNVFVIIIAVRTSFVMHEISQNEFKRFHSTEKDCIIFSGSYGITLTQSAFNTLSFLLICSSFRDFVKMLLSTWRERIGIRQEPTVNVTSGMETTVL